MASDAVKYTPIKGGGGTTPRFTHSDIITFFSLGKTRKTTTFAYAFVFTFVAFTVFLAFSPSPNSYSPWFSNIFAVSGNGGGGGDSSPADSYRFSPIFSHFFPNSSSPGPNSRSDNNTVSQSPSSNLTDPVAKNQTSQSPSSNFSDPVAKNQTSRSPSLNFADPVAKTASSGSPISKNSTFPSNKTSPVPEIAAAVTNVTDELPIRSKNESQSDISSTLNNKKPSVSNNQTLIDQNSVKNQTLKSNQRTIAAPEPPSDPGSSAKQETEDWVESLKNCDFFDGNWVMDESYPLYKPGSCNLIDEQFNCIRNGRPDKEFQMLKWKPKKCTLPRLNGAHMLEMIRGRRLVFVGDSLNRNMWESMVCILRGSAKNQSNVYEANGRHHFRTEAEYSFVFKDYNCTVEFFVSPFLVQEWEVTDTNGTKKETLRLDLVGQSSEQYKGADIIIFNTGHWWTHEKTSKGEDYYQEGSHVYSELNVLEAFRKAITTWARWVDKNVNPAKSLVFFRGYSASHFSGGQWNSGGACDSETEPIRNETYLTPYPSKMQVLERVIKGMKTPVTYLNITRLTDYRKDGHPSVYRKQNVPEEERKSPLRFQDCSHWCLPGVPDSWNEILYAEILVQLNRLT